MQSPTALPRRGRRGRRCAPPARNPLQLHVVLRSRDRDPPARGGHVGAARRAARRAPHRPLGAHAVRGAGRHLGGRPQSLSAGRPARQSEAAGAARRGDAPPAARDRQAARQRRRRRGARRARSRGSSRPRARRSTASPRRSRRPPSCASATRRVLARYTRQGQHRASTASRASRTSPTPPTGASNIRSSCSIRTPRTRCAAWSKAASSSA